MDIVREFADFYSQFLFTLNYFSIIIWGGFGLCALGAIIDPPGRKYDGTGYDLTID